MADHSSDRPSDWLVDHAELLPTAGRALDLAAGAGRNARWLAQRGFDVLAFDRDISRLGDLVGVEPRSADLETGATLRAQLPEGAAFDCIVVCNYLYRPILAELADLLTPGGVLVYETFAVGNERFGRPRNPDFLLRANELLHTFANRLVVLAFEHGEVRGLSGRSMRQRIVARSDG